MKIFLGIALGAVCLAQGTQNIVLNGSNQAASVTLPSSPYGSVTSMRFDLRMSGFALNISTRQQIFVGGGTVLCAILENTSTLSCTDFFESGSPTSTVSLAGRTDVLARFTKIAGGDEVIEIWNSDGTNYASSCSPGSGGNCPQVGATARNWSGAFPLGNNGSGNWFNGQIAYFRWYSSTVPVGFDASLPPSNVAGGDLLDYEFEGNGNDLSSHGENLTLAGSPGYATTAFYVYLPVDFTAQSGSSFMINGAGAGASSYSWTQTAGASCTLSNSSSATLTVSGCSGFGQRTFKLAATSAASQNSNATVNVGIVVTDSRGVVQVSDSNWGWLVGPLTAASPSGPAYSPWSFLETQRAALTNYWYSSPTAAPGGAWPTTMGGAQESLLYYCSICGLYRQYFRTGLTAYQTYARSLASTAYGYSDGWNNGSPSGGCASNWTAPRDSTAEGIIMWLYDTGGNLSASSCVQQYVDFEFGNYLEQRDITQGYQGLYFGARESSYAYNFAVYLSVLSNVNVNSHGLWTARIANEFANYWLPYQCPSNYNAGCGKLTASITGTVTTHGTTTLTGSGTAFSSAFSVGAQRAVVTYGGTGYGSAPTVTSSSYSGASFTANMSGGSVASITINTPGMPTSANFVQNLAFSGGSPTTAATGYTEAGHVWVDDSSTCPSLQIVSTWKNFPITAIGSDTSMTLEYAPGGSNSSCLAYADSQGAANDTGATRWGDEWPGFMEQPWHISIGAEGIARYYLSTSDNRALTYLENEANELSGQEYNAASCVGTTVRSVVYAQYSAGPFGTGCATAGDLHADRANADTVPHIYGWLYRFTGSASWLTTGDNFFSALFGDSGTGPGTDGYWGQFDIVDGTKFYGQSLRSADSYLANRLAPAALDRVVVFAITPSADPGAAQVEISLTAADGSTSQNTCSASPCIVTADVAGLAQLQIQYQKSGGAALSSTGISPISVPIQ